MCYHGLAAFADVCLYGLLDLWVGDDRTFGEVKGTLDE